MRSFSFAVLLPWLMSGCASPAGNRANRISTVAVDPDSVDVVAVDRFSEAAGHLFKRSADSSLPAANAAVDFDTGGFITHGLGPAGEHIAYYNFDVMPTYPQRIYVLFAEGAAAPVAGQLSIVDSVPGDINYSDFWRVVRVTVPAGYVPNAITSVADIVRAALPQRDTATIVNCPVVPDGSVARLRYGADETTGLQRGWYRGEVVKYFTFDERALAVDAAGQVPLSDIYVTFNKNPDPSDPSSGPASGFVTEPGSDQVHNVTETLPKDVGYSPFWDVNVYDHSAFAAVSDLGSAMAAPSLGKSIAKVNCPIVSVP